MGALWFPRCVQVRVGGDRSRCQPGFAGFAVLCRTLAGAGTLRMSDFIFFPWML